MRVRHGEALVAAAVHTVRVAVSTVWSVTPPNRRSWPFASRSGAGIRPRHKLIMVAVVLVVLVFVASQIQLPYYAMSPGQAVPVETMVSVPKGMAHRVHGALFMTDVFVTPVRLLDLPAYWLSSDTTLLSSKELLGGISAKQFQSLSVAEMHHSKLQAVVAALKWLGYQVPGYSGAVIDKVAPGTPAAAARLAAGEVITSINSRPTPDVLALVHVLQSLKPGDLVNLGIVVPSRVKGSATLGASRVVTVRLGARKVKLGSSGRMTTMPYLGVLLGLSREERFKLPFPVTINSGSIGGPSAGLAFTLGVIDELTSGELTGGRRVAATGTIRINGTVGEVGGVAQKTVAVERAGASVFIVPAGEYSQARSHANSRLTVLGVTTLSQAIRDLERLGGHLGPGHFPKFPLARSPAS